MDKNRLYTLLTKYQEHTCTKEELQELENWYGNLDTANQPVANSDALANEMLTQFRRNLVTETKTITFYKKKFFRMTAAAAIIILAVGSYFIFFKNQNNQEQLATIKQPNDFAAPNATKAYITLSNGSRVYLDSLKNGIVMQEGNITINKQGDQVIYAGSQQQAASIVSYNTLTVPKGSKPFKLLLADGSTVWLDAASTITYPTLFIGKERKVELKSGQAYFEIAHNSAMPFKVKKADAEVEVLGTHFNINAFDDEPAMKVTLLEGSVRVNKGKSSITIKPGQQAQANSAIKVINADLEEVMAWKNDNFQFEGADINTVMKQLARWYNVEIQVRGNIPEHFGGTISRNVNVSKVFEMLKLTGEVNYKIDGRKITVTP